MILGAEHCCTCKGVYDLCCVRLATAPQLLPLTRLTGQMYPQSAGSAHGPLIPDRETCPAESSCLLLTETNMCTAASPPPRTREIQHLHHLRCRPGELHFHPLLNMSTVKDPTGMFPDQSKCICSFGLRTGGMCLELYINVESKLCLSTYPSDVSRPASSGQSHSILFYSILGKGGYVVQTQDFSVQVF